MVRRAMARSTALSNEYRRTYARADRDVPVGHRSAEAACANYKAVSQEARDYVRTRLVDTNQVDLSTFGVQSYRKHGSGQGRTDRLRGIVTQPGT